MLVLLFGILIVLGTLSLPGQFAHMAKESPDLAYLRWPLTLASVFWVVCALVVVTCTWKLLKLVTEDVVFSAEAFTWVDGIVAAFASSWVTFVALGAYITVFVADDPSVPILILLVSTVLTIASLLMVIMRSLLRQATSLRAEMEAVI